MDTAADLVRTARRRRRLTQKELARVSGVSPSTLSRVEAGKVDPTYGTLAALMRSMGYRFGDDLQQESTDEQIAKAVEATYGRRRDRLAAYRVAGQVAPVTKRIGVKPVVADLDDMLVALEGSGSDYAFSSFEGYYGGWSERGTASFWPVVYVDAGVEWPWRSQLTPGVKGTVYVLPLTEFSRRHRERVGGMWAMSPDWSLIDAIASPGRQADVGLEILEGLQEVEATKFDDDASGLVRHALVDGLADFTGIDDDPRIESWLKGFEEATRGWRDGLA